MAKGFTLIEALIYIALFSIIIGGALVVTYQIIEGNQQVSANVVIQEETNFLMRKIDWALSGASIITTPAVGASGAVLNVTKEGIVLEFDESGGIMRLKTGAGSPIDLNSSNVTVENLLFTHSDPDGAGGKPAELNISFDIAGQNFNATKNLRK